MMQLSCTSSPASTTLGQHWELPWGLGSAGGGVLTPLPLGSVTPSPHAASPVCSPCLFQPPALPSPVPDVSNPDTLQLEPRHPLFHEHNPAPVVPAPVVPVPQTSLGPSPSQPAPFLARSHRHLASPAWERHHLPRPWLQLERI